MASAAAYFGAPGPRKILGRTDYLPEKQNVLQDALAILGEVLYDYGLFNQKIAYETIDDFHHRELAHNGGHTCHC